MIRYVNDIPWQLPVPGGSLADKYPDLIKEWDCEKNAPVSPEMVAAYSNRYAYWKCDRGHSFKAEVYSRTRQGARCPYCSGRKPIKGETDFATRNPYWAARWDYSLNKDRPEDITWCSGKKRFFRCDNCQNSFDMTISHINRPTKKGPHCPYCNNERLLKGFNDLATVFPEIAKYWDYGKNGVVTPDNVFSGGQKKYWWKCENGYPHSFQTIIDVRKICGCPYCAQCRVLPGFNDLETRYPAIAEEWDRKKNVGVDPSEVLAGGERKAWWVCPDCRKSYLMSVRDRILGHGCRECKNRFGTSFPEQAIFYYIKQFFADAELHYVENKMELDVFIPSLRIGIEYDGVKYHYTMRKQKIDKERNDYCKTNNIKLIRVREEGLPIIDGCKTYITQIHNSISHLNKIIVQILRNELNISDDKMNVNIRRDYNNIYAEYRRSLGEASLAAQYPDLIEKQWEDRLNYPLLPTMLTPGNMQVYCWWHCSRGHKFQKIPNTMVKAYLKKVSTEGCNECLKILRGQKGGLYRAKRARLEELFNESIHSQSGSP